MAVKLNPARFPFAQTGLARPPPSAGAAPSAIDPSPARLRNDRRSIRDRRICRLIASLLPAGPTSGLADHFYDPPKTLSQRNTARRGGTVNPSWGRPGGSAESGGQIGGGGRVARSGTPGSRPTSGSPTIPLITGSTGRREAKVRPVR